ncbi:hypothetical protein U1Q18_048622, partial [Sarracenia purpurea var. burkii]
ILNWESSTGNILDFCRCVVDWKGRKFRQLAPGGRRSERSEVVGLALPTTWIHQSSSLCSSVSRPRSDSRSGSPICADLQTSGRSGSRIA